MQQSRSDSPYFFDASTLINLERQGKLGPLSELGNLVVIHERIAGEVSKDPRSDLAVWLKRNPKSITRTFLPQETELYVKLRQQRTPKVHDPEAIAIALAAHRNGILVCDDGAARQKANHYGVACMTVDQFIEFIQPRMF